MSRNCITLALILILAGGCATAPPRRDHTGRAERLAIAAILADGGSTVIGLSMGGLKEGGIFARWTDDTTTALATSIVVNAALVYGLRRAHRKFPHWGGWRQVHLAVAVTKGFAAVSNARLILEQ